MEAIWAGTGVEIWGRHGGLPLQVLNGLLFVLVNGYIDPDGEGAVPPNFAMGGRRPRRPNHWTTPIPVGDKRSTP